MLLLLFSFCCVSLSKNTILIGKQTEILIHLQKFRHPAHAVQHRTNNLSSIVTVVLRTERAHTYTRFQTDPQQNNIIMMAAAGWAFLGGLFILGLRGCQDVGCQETKNKKRKVGRKKLMGSLRQKESFCFQLLDLWQIKKLNLDKDDLLTNSSLWDKKRGDIGYFGMALTVPPGILLPFSETH